MTNRWDLEPCVSVHSDKVSVIWHFTGVWIGDKLLGIQHLFEGTKVTNYWGFGTLGECNTITAVVLVPSNSF